TPCPFTTLFRSRAAAARDQRRVDGLIAAVRHEDLLADVDVDPLLGPDVAWTPDGVDLVEVGGADPSPFADLPECVVALPPRHASPRRQAFERTEERRVGRDGRVRG